MESLLRHWNDADPPCPECGKPLERQPAAPKAIWMKPYSEYGLRPSDIEAGRFNPDGVEALKTKSTRHVDGTPEKVLLRTYQDAKRFCRDEGLQMPDEMNSNVTVKQDSKTIDTAGLNGQWV
jgi:hypothetical protein